MTSTKLIAVVLTCLFATTAFAADAAKEAAPTKEIAAAKEAPKPATKEAPKAAKPAMDAKGMSSHLGDTKIDLRHCLKEGTNREIHRCTL